jgi:hypothetical protein
MTEETLTIDIERTGLSTEFSNLFRSFASLYNAVHEELEHRAPSRGSERLRVQNIEVHSPGHIIFHGMPLVTQWLDILVNACNAAVGAAGLWLAFKAQSQVAWEKREQAALKSENDWLLRLTTVMTLDLFIREAERLEAQYDLYETPDFPPPKDAEDQDSQLTFEFLGDHWTEFSPNDKKGIQAIQQIKAMQRRHLIGQRRTPPQA